MFGIFDKPIDKLTLEDIKSLVKRQVPENQNLDYKQEYKFLTESDKNKFLANICSFANSKGGYLIYGIKERKEGNKKTGCPEKNIVGLKNFIADSEISSFESSIRERIQPRITGIKPKLIESNESDPVLVIEIPQSLKVPHAVTVGHAYKFYSRDSKGNYPINKIEEIRDLFLKGKSHLRMMEDFRSERIKAVKNGNTHLIRQGEPCFVLHVLPTDSFLSENKTLNIEKAYNSCNLLPIGSSGCNPQINYYGLYMSEVGDYLQIYQNGRIEAITTSAIWPDDNTIGSYYEGKFVESVKNYIEKLEFWEIKGPFYVYISLLNVRGFRIREGNVGYGEGISQDDLLFSQIEFLDKNQVSHEKFKHKFDLVWNACGHLKSPNFDSKGNWQGKR